MVPGTHDFIMPKGSTLNKVLTYKIDGSAVNLTGYTARMQARPNQASSTVVFDMTTGNGKITLGGTAGTITLSLTAAETAAVTQSALSYDFELVAPGGDVTRLFEGQITLTPEVTR